MQRNSSAPNDAVPVTIPILILAALLVPVLVVAFVILYVLPHDVGGSIFAWPVNPRMSSMMLGATYMGGAYFFTVVLLSRKWRHVWLGIIPVTSFATFMGIATLLHWDLFSHERFTFLIWVLLYFTVPVLLPLLWLHNRRLARGARFTQEGALPPFSRWAFGILGVILTFASLLLLILPELMIAVWPWTLTPLTARIMAAMFILPGLAGLGLAYDGTWSGARFILQAQAFSILLMLIAVVIARADFNWANPASWIFTAGLSSVVILVLITYILRMRRA